MGSAAATEKKGITKRELVGAAYLSGDLWMGINGYLKYLAYNQRFADSGDQNWAKKRDAAMRETITGAVWAIGGVAMAGFGERPLEDQQKALEGRLAKHFHGKGLKLDPELAAKATRELEKGFFEHVKDFCYRYPTEILNVVYGGMAAYSLLWDGWKQEVAPALKEGKSFGLKTAGNTVGINDVSTFGMGLMISLGALFGLAVKEKSKEQLDEAGSTGFSRWVQEKPMRVTGAFYLANNYFTYANMMANKEEFKDSDNGWYKNMYLFRGGTLASYLFGNITLMGTATGAQKADTPTEEAKQKILDATAKVILAQSPEQQQALIKQTASYLANQRELGFSRHTERRLAEMITTNLQTYAEKPAPGAEEKTWAGRRADTAVQPEAAPGR